MINIFSDFEENRWLPGLLIQTFLNCEKHFLLGSINIIWFEMFPIRYIDS